MAANIAGARIQRVAVRMAQGGAKEAERLADASIGQPDFTERFEPEMLIGIKVGKAANLDTGRGEREPPGIV